MSDAIWRISSWRNSGLGKIAQFASVTTVIGACTSHETLVKATQLGSGVAPVDTIVGPISYSIILAALV